LEAPITLSPRPGKASIIETIIHPEHLSMLTEVLARYCRTARIEPGTLQYALTGKRIIALFQIGVHTEDEILASLDGDGT
jgi:hypothetical protein